MVTWTERQTATRHWPPTPTFYILLTLRPVQKTAREAWLISKLHFCMNVISWLHAWLVVPVATWWERTVLGTWEEVVSLFQCAGFLPGFSQGCTILVTRFLAIPRTCACRYMYAHAHTHTHGTCTNTHTHTHTHTHARTHARTHAGHGCHKAVLPGLHTLPEWPVSMAALFLPAWIP